MGGGRFEVIAKGPLPDYIFQFDILHYVWNITKRIYDKKHTKYKFRDRAAEFAKSSFPLIVTSALDSIGSTMSNEDKIHSLPIIKLGKPLVPHNFNEVKERIAKKSWGFLCGYWLSVGYLANNLITVYSDSNFAERFQNPIVP